MNALKIVPLCLPFLVFPMQTRQASKIAVERHSSNCSGLSNTECCEQMLRLSAYKSIRDQLPDLAIQAVKMSCNEKQKTATKANCRGIAFSRGFSPKEVNKVCSEAGIKRRCAKNPNCRDCTKQLARLSYQNSYWTCSAVTWKPRGKSNGTKVITIESGDRPDSSSTGQVIKRRERLQ